MVDTVHLPGLGDVKKGYAIAGGVAVVGGFYVMYRRQQQANATAAAGANTGIDPATGYAFGSPEDAAALSAQQSYVNPTTNVGGGGGLVSSGGSTLPQSFLSNAAWSQYVINYMTSNAIVQDNGAALTAALAVYLNGGVPTADQTSLINQAVAIGGLPPIPGPNSYPPHINTGPPITQGPNPPTPTPTGPHYTTVLAGWAVDQWINDVRAGKAGFPAPDFSWEKLLMLNPGAVFNVRGNHANSAQNTFINQAVYRID